MSRDLSEEVAGVRSWYNLVAENFGKSYSGARGAFLKHCEEGLALELLQGPRERILDLGCGAGRLADSLSGCAAQVVGIDVSESMISVARRQPHAPNVGYCVMDATRSALKPASFDAVVSLGMFEYLADPSPFLKEILRVLRPGGRVIFTCHSKGSGLVRAWNKVGAMWKPRPKGVSQPLPERDSFYRTVAHQPEQLLSLLREEGFVAADFRGFHFPPAWDGFVLSSAVPIGPLSRWGTSLAGGLDRWLGRLPATRWMSTLAMFTARKPS